MRYQGTYVPLITPLDNNGQVCESSVARLLEQTRQHVSGFVPCLTSGEGWCLSPQQWQAMVATTLAYAGDRKVIAGIERATTAEVLDLAHRAEALGVTSIIITTPFGQGVTQTAMEHHFRTLHETTRLEIFIYNESALSGNAMHWDTLLRAAELPRVVGVKDSAEEPRSPGDIAALQLRGLAYFLGWENQLAGQAHADGNIVSLGNLEPALCQQAMAGKDSALQSSIDQLCDEYSLFADDWYRHVKTHLLKRGVILSDQIVTP